MSGALAWIDGELLPEDEAALPCRDRGLQYGDGLFETMRAEGGRVLLLDAHIARLRSGLAALRIDFPGADGLAREAAGALARGLGGPGAATIKLVATRGEGPAGPSPRGEFRPRLYGLARADAAERPRSMRAVFSGVRRDERSPVVNLKTLCYLELVLARGEAADAGADEAVLLNSAGRVAEASAANVFAVSAGRLLTPRPEEGCLPGVVRAEVIAAAGEMGIEVLEGRLLPEELLLADEVFLTNSRIGVVPLERIESRPIGDAVPGPVTERLSAAYRERELASV